MIATLAGAPTLSVPRSSKDGNTRAALTARWKYLGKKILFFTFVIPMSAFEPSWAPSHAAHHLGPISTIHIAPHLLQSRTTGHTQKQAVRLPAPPSSAEVGDEKRFPKTYGIEGTPRAHSPGVHGARRAYPKSSMQWRPRCRSSQSVLGAYDQAHSGRLRVEHVCARGRLGMTPFASKLGRWNGHRSKCKVRQPVAVDCLELRLRSPWRLGGAMA
jgi:hypothetical protein